jgi:hypothetical protein
MTPLGGATAMMLMAASLSHADRNSTTASPARLELVASNQTRPCGVSWIDSQIQRISKLKRNWDGYDAAPVSLGQLNLLSRLLADSLPSGTTAGSIVPAADGSLQAEWHLRHASFGLVLEEGAPISVWYQPRHGGPEIERTGVKAIGLLQYAALQSMA